MAKYDRLDNVYYPCTKEGIDRLNRKEDGVDQKLVHSHTRDYGNKSEKPEKGYS